MRIYVLEYGENGAYVVAQNNFAHCWAANNMTFMGNVPSEKRTEYFQLEERQTFLKRYNDLKKNITMKI